MKSMNIISFFLINGFSQILFLVKYVKAFFRQCKCPFKITFKIDLPHCACSVQLIVIVKNHLKKREKSLQKFKDQTMQQTITRYNTIKYKHLSNTFFFKY